jgi:hypothetical protein
MTGKASIICETLPVFESIHNRSLRTVGMGGGGYNN